MTYAQAFKGADPEEVTRRHAVCVKLNKLWDAMQENPENRMAYYRKISAIKREEAGWLKEAAFFLYN